MSAFFSAATLSKAYSWTLTCRWPWVIIVFCKQTCNGGTQSSKQGNSKAPLNTVLIRFSYHDFVFLLTNAYMVLIHFSDPAVHALQFLDVINMKDPTQKAHFYRSTLKDALPFIPRVSIRGIHSWNPWLDVV